MAEKEYCRFALVIPTIGIPELFESLTSVAAQARRPDQTIVVVDRKGRRLAGLHGTVAGLERRIRAALPGVEVLYNRHEQDWEMNNQTFNIGVEAVRHQYAYTTHDDVFFPDEEDYFLRVGQAAAVAAAGGFTKQVVGCSFPSHHLKVDAKGPFHPRPTLVKMFSAVASMIDVGFWEQIGRFDVTHGIWWDAQVQGELTVRDRWMYYEPLPMVRHHMNRALTANGHARDWSHAPRWKDCGAAYERVYGAPHTHWDKWYERDGSVIELAPRQ